MDRKRNRRSGALAFGALLGMVLVGIGWTTVHASSHDAGVEQERLIQRIKEEILQELKDGNFVREELKEDDFLQKEINAGIKRFVQQQRELQARAPDEQARKNVRPVSKSRDHIYGNPDAEISLIEYSDFECPFCKKFHPTAKQIVDASEGKVNWVYRHFPLDFHNPSAQKEAEASECAAELGGNEAFWQYTDLIYQRTRSNGKGFPIEGLTPLAEEIGLNRERFQECLQSERHGARVQEDYQNGMRSGVSGTPGNILLHNRTGAAKVKPGAVPFNALKAEIERMQRG